MNILFVYSLADIYTVRHPLMSYENIHFGISYLSAALKSSGHTTRLLVLSCMHRAKSTALVDEAIKTFSPDIMAFTSVATQYPFIKGIADHVRENRPDIYLVVGGVHASLCSADLLKGSFDAVCIGEGEYPLVELAGQMEAGRTPGGIQNLWIRSPDGTIERNSVRCFLQNLDELPFPDRDMWAPWIVQTARSRHAVLLGRGCPYSCAYCCNHALRKLAEGSYIRFRSPENIVNELHMLDERYPGGTSVYLQVETLLLNKAWALSLCDLLWRFNRQRQTPCVFSCNYRIAATPPEEDVFQSMSRANIKLLEIGVESGSERLRKEILQRNYSNENCLKTVELARKYGMDVNVYNMMGFPTETMADHWDTIRLNRAICPKRSLTSIFYPYPGTKLYERCLADGLITPGEKLDPLERRRASLDLPTFPKKKIQRAYCLFEWRIYVKTKPFLFRFRRLIRSCITANQTTGRLFNMLLPYWHALRRRAGIEIQD